MMQSNQFSRRSMLEKAGITAASLAAGTLFTRPSRAESLSSESVLSESADRSEIELAGRAIRANLAEGSNFSLPVLTDQRDPRTAHIKQTSILVDDALRTNPPDLPVETIDFNPKYSFWEAKNRLNVATSNALIRAHAISTQYLDGEDYSKLAQMLQDGEVPADPDWDEYLALIDSKESLTLPLMALPEGAPMDTNNVEWFDVNVRKGIKLNYVAEPGLFEREVDADYNPIDGWTLRVSPDAQLSLDLFWNNISYQDFADKQTLYDGTFSAIMVRALTCVTMTLGIFQGQSHLYGRYFVLQYSDKDNYGTSLFQDQNELVIGTVTETGYPEALLHVNLAEK